MAAAKSLKSLAEFRAAGQHGVKNRSPGLGTGHVDEAVIAPFFGGIMIIEVAVPDDWTAGQVLAVRQLFQHAMRNAQPVICPVRDDVTPDQLHDLYNRIHAMIREVGLAVPARAA